MMNSKLYLAALICVALFSGLCLAACAPEEPGLEPIYATIEIQIPCTDPLHVQPPEETVPEGPTLTASPLCGTLAEEYGGSGSEITLYGRGFYPNSVTALIWDDGIGEFGHRQGGEYILPVSDEAGAFSVTILLPYRLLPPDIDEDYQIWRLTAFQGEPPEKVIPILWDRLFEHLYISGVGGVMGIVAGVSVGYYLAKALYSLIKSRPSLGPVSFFIPWRTMLVSVLMLLVFPVWLIITFGLTARAGTVGTSLVILILAAHISSTLFLWKWQRPSMMYQLASALRTLLVLSVLITTWLGYFGMGGVGRLISVYVTLFEYEIALRYFLLIVLTLLLFDLLGGVVALMLNRREEQAQAVSEPEG